MKSKAFVLPAAALSAAWLLLSPGEAPGFKLTGHSLRLTHRDVRVHDNFTDAEANANTTPDPSFPGYVGAELAIWKACVEWGSELHFEGQGDPLQPGDLGSGGANFDPSWQGNADDPGGPNDNVHSEIGGSSGGVIAFTETPTSNGWRIRYFRNPWVFYDNPNFGPSASQHYDLQGIATHEYGHALGLDHSNSQGATMFSASLLNGTDYRTIENDDIQGIRVIYGSASADKPHVDTYAHLGGDSLSIRGHGFHANDNEVWFTQAGRGGDGTPVKVTGIASTAGGTELVLQVPPEAGPGDVLVKLPGGSFSALSNAFPFDPHVGPCPEPVVYGTGKVNSTNLPARIGWLGTPSLSQQNFTITLTDGPYNEWGRVFWGSGKKATPFFGGWMLTTPPKHRGARFSISAFGFATAKIKIDPSMVGETRYYQCWYRDLQSPQGAGTSNALEITFCD